MLRRKIHLGPSVATSSLLSAQTAVRRRQSSRHPCQESQGQTQGHTAAWANAAAAGAVPEAAVARRDMHIRSRPDPAPVAPRKNVQYLRKVLKIRLGCHTHGGSLRCDEEGYPPETKKSQPEAMERVARGRIDDRASGSVG
jgi:hypothetical protein